MGDAETSRDSDSDSGPGRPALPPRPGSEPISDQRLATGTDSDTRTSNRTSVDRQGTIYDEAAPSVASARTSMTNDTKSRSRISALRFGKAKNDEPPAQPEAPPLPERPKVIYRNSARQFLKLQLPSVLVTITLLVLYILQVQFVATPNQVAALLFAAKFHEGLITISLIDMVYYHIRRSLIGRKGVSYGILSSPFQMTQPMYIFTSELWSGIKASKSDSVLMSGLIVLSLILATVVGASSGNIMLPQPVWGADKRGRGSYYSSFVSSSLFVVSPARDIYPVSMTNRWNSTLDACQGNTNYCPYSKFTDPQAPLYTWMTDTWVSEESRNVSVASDDRREVVLARRSDKNQGPVLTATVAPACISDNLNRNWDYAGGNGGKDDRKSARFMAITSQKSDSGLRTIKQPRVTSSCFEVPPGTRSASDGITDVFEMPLGFYHNFTVQVPADRFREAIKSDESFGVMDINDLLPPGNTSSLALWTKSPRQDNIMGLCLFDARWIDGNSWIYPRDPGGRVLNDFQTSDFTAQNYDSLDPATQINIDRDWFESLNTILVPRNDNLLLPGSVSHAFDLIDSYILDRQSTDSYYGKYDAHLASAMTVFLTTALAQVPCQNAFSYADNSGGGLTLEVDRAVNNGSIGSLPTKFSDLDKEGDHVVLSKIFNELNYGYSFGGGVTKMSWIPLLAHLLLVIVHLGILLRNRGQGTTKAWGSLGELLTLAMNTAPPSVLTNAGGGVRDQTIWGLNTVVRQVGGEGGIGGQAGKIEFVLRDRRKYGRVGQDEGEDGLGAREDDDGVVLLDRMRRYG